MNDRLTDRQGTRRLKVVITYDTADMGRRAMRTLRSALDATQPEAPTLDLRLWRLDLLADSELLALAHADIGEADMLLLAIQRTASLPPAMDSWLQRLSNKGAGTRGFALLIDQFDQGNDSPSCHAFESLRLKARANRLDFFANISPAVGTTDRTRHVEQARKSGPRTSSRSTFERLEFSRGWGIND